MHYDSAQQMFFLLAYGFLAWVVEVIYYAIRNKRFINRGILSLPIDFELGVVFSNISVVLPTLGRNYAAMYLLTFANLIIVRAVLGFFGSLLTKNAKWMEAAPSGTWRGLALNAVSAGVILIIYLLLQPLMIVLATVIPDIVLVIVRIVAWVLILIDFITLLIAAHKGRENYEESMERGKTDELSVTISRMVWKRLEKAYPGIRDEQKRGEIVFAKGMSLDKIIWVFLISALLGDIIETFYCRIVGGTWMSRSSVVFGPFSFVWGIGAVVLTVSLMRLKDKNDRWVLLAGALLGGAFEYMCSVFTEIVFGKVFWDYSYMPLNIGGRTNVLFMFFWGILGLVWVKIAYPPLDRFIEKFPPIAAKVFTWLIIVLMGFNALFTAAVMLRYNERKENPQPANVLERFIDETYGDDFVEQRWQNMVDS